MKDSEYSLAEITEFDSIYVGLCDWGDWGDTIFYEQRRIFQSMELQGKATVHNC